MMKPNIQCIAFDADDTLWENEDHFQTVETEFRTLLRSYGTNAEIGEQLFQTEMRNLEIYGYGTKSFTLSMLETALRVSSGQAESALLSKIIALGKSILQHPVVLLPHVREVLTRLSPDFRLAIATKGDLQEQRRKLTQSGLLEYFDHVEIMSEKHPEDYRRLLTHLEIPPDALLMVGNSVKSDILPVLELGAYAVHIPYHLTWQHEIHDAELTHPRLYRTDDIRQVPDLVLPA